MQLWYGNDTHVYQAHTLELITIIIDCLVYKVYFGCNLWEIIIQHDPRQSPHIGLLS